MSNEAFETIEKDRESHQCISQQKSLRRSGFAYEASLALTCSLYMTMCSPTR
jgi:hypothetical protein